MHRSDYKESLKSMADTCLFELAVDVCRDVEINMANPSYKGHQTASDIYQEFWRRDKGNIYFNASSIAKKQLGKHVSVST